MNKTYKNNKMPFFELAYNQTINGCPKSHIHDKLTIIAIENGSLRLLLKDEIIIKKNYLAIVNPYQTHSAFKIDLASEKCYALYFDKIWIEALQQELFSTDKYIPIKTNLINNKTLYIKFVLLCKSILSDSFMIEKEDLVYQFVIELLQYCELDFQTDNQNFLLDEIKEYIDTNLSLDLDLTTIAKEFHITTFHLIRFYKKELGLTPYQYILNQKINLAKELISIGYPIASVAYECGFSDQSHLYKYFKSIFSITPKEYQKSIL